MNYKTDPIVTKSKAYFKSEYGTHAIAWFISGLMIGFFPIIGFLLICAILIYFIIQNRRS